MLDAALAHSRPSGSGRRPSIEVALKTALLEGLELKPRKAFGPIRVAATGASISPPLFESLELLGRDRSLAGCARGPRPCAPPLGGGVKCEREIFGSLLVGPVR